MRDEHPLDRQVERRTQLANQLGTRSRLEPRRGTEVDPGVRPEEHVTRHERRVVLQPDEQLRTRGDVQQPDTRGQRTVAARHDPSAVSVGELGAASLVPRAREEDDDRITDARDVPVERLEEPGAVVRIVGNERIDEHDRVARLAVHAPDVAIPAATRLPLRVRSRPAPEPIRNPRHLHAEDATVRLMESASDHHVSTGAGTPALDPLLAAERAVAEERQRIARELHDVVAHSVSVMTVQAGAVRRLLRDDQIRERQALETVEATGREALTEMRRLVGLLRKQGAMPEFAPQPSMRTVDVLVGTVREAGLPVELDVDGTPRELPPGVDLSAYRVIQEALTNALKYAGPARAWVTVRWLEHELVLEIANDGRSEAGGDGGGHGLAGLRERVALVGGTVESGPRESGGFVVVARLPLDPPS